MSQAGIVIIGAGAAGLSAATTVRSGGYDGPLTVVHGETHPPYNRTLVNKAVLPGLLGPQQAIHPAVGELGQELIRARARAVDPDRVVVLLEDGSQLPYAALIAATGSAPRAEESLAVNSARVFHLHTLDDALRLRQALDALGRTPTVTILGAGTIGAETASHFTTTGAQVHLVSRSATPLATTVGQRIATRLTDLHRAHVQAHLGRNVTAVEAGSQEVRVRLGDGTTLVSDVAVIAHGTTPASSWLTGRGGGVPVDSRLRALGHRDTYAAGALAVHTAGDGQRYRLDHWEAAADQGAHAARAVLHDLTGAPDPGPYVPTGGFTLSVYGHTAAAYGIRLPGGYEQQHDTGNPDTALTGFYRPDGQLTAVAGFDAFDPLLAARAELTDPEAVRC